MINFPTKICIKCKQEKSIDDFTKRKNFKNICLICCKLIRKSYYLKNSEYYDKQHKTYYNKHREQYRSRQKIYRLKNWEKLNEHTILRMKTDPVFKLHEMIRSGIKSAINRKSKTNKTANTNRLLMCSIPELKQHLEKQFTSGMTWNNHGLGNNKWHIDHIIPCAFFNLLDPIEQYMCFRYQNLQPLWQQDNLKKHSEMDYSLLYKLENR